MNEQPGTSERKEVPAVEQNAERPALTPEQIAARDAAIEQAHTEALEFEAQRVAENAEEIARIKEDLGIPTPEQQERVVASVMTLGINEKVGVDVRLDASGNVTEVLGDIAQGGFESYTTDEFRRIFERYQRVGIPVGWKESLIPGETADGKPRTVKAFRIAKEDVNAALKAGDIEMRIDPDQGLTMRVVGRRG